ncbi:MAG: histidine kinase dimerization/phospho-acceptor domain-containing protein [Ferruginibacter sp.]
MKLFARHNRINIITSILIFIGGCIVFYFLVHYILIHQLDERLDTEREEIEQYALHYQKLPHIMNTSDQQVYYSEINEPLVKAHFLSEKTWNEVENEKELMRKLLFGVTVSGKNYEVKVQITQEYQDALLKLIILVTFIMIAAILLAGYIINRIVLKNLWKPFYKSIHEIAAYNLHKQERLQLPVADIDEFNLLNKSLNDMTARVETDYQTLKEFTANAAHEMQTPLAVISANTESIMQDETMLGIHHESILSIEDAVKRLSRLNQSLLLLTKIENRRFVLTDQVEWEVLIKERLHELQELITINKISVTENTTAVSTVFHIHLAEILITNLLSNATRYNVEGGIINIKLDSAGLMISNTSVLPALDTDRVFDRFYRHPKTKLDGNGLGLSIVQQICKLAGYAVFYKYENGMHFFIVKF